ncbi:hypothetical protein D3C84_722440 [compost metagenome]
MGEEVAVHLLDFCQYSIGKLRSSLQFDCQDSLRLTDREPGSNVIGESSTFPKFMHQPGGENLVRHLQCHKVRTVAQDAGLGEAHVSLGRRSLQLQKTWRGGVVRGFDRGDGWPQRQCIGNLYANALGFVLRKVADQRYHRVACRIRLAMEILHLIAGDGGKPDPGSINGLFIAMSGGQ